MKNVIIFGFGEMGKKLVNECYLYDSDINIVVIADNNWGRDHYKNIQVIKPVDICKHEYDEIWICTVYFEEIMNQLEQLGIDRSVMHYIEPVVPILEYRLRKSGLLENSIYKQEREYLENHHLRMYCYPFYDEYLFKSSNIFFDEKKGLYYGYYNQYKMYLARKFNTEQKARAYFNAVTMEQDERSPHCYWNYKQIRNQSGVAVDIGAAEGIYGLKIIEQVDYLYMIEADEEWIEALTYTYEPYLEKVTIIQRFIGNSDNHQNAKLDTIFEKISIDSIKMDIEGMEIDALRGADNVLRNSNPVLAICVYHHASDNDYIHKWLRDRGYETENSNGFVVCQGDWELEHNEIGLRKALLFGMKGSEK